MSYIDRHLIRVALGQDPAELVLRGGKVVNVCTHEVYLADVAIADGRIAVVGDAAYCIGGQTSILDLRGKFLSPGLIDAHIHPEVSKITLGRLADAVVPRGTTAIVCSLDQIGVTTGLEGMRWVLDEAKRSSLRVFHASPSRLPYTTPASTIGHEFGPAEHMLAQKWNESVGIWEYMADSVVDFDRPVIEAANVALGNRLQLHGHAPATTGGRLAACAAAGMANDHETSGPDELVEKLTNGLYGFIRRGTHTDNIAECVKVVTEMGYPAHCLALCTDDVDCLDITELGLLDFLVKYVITLGVDPVTAIQMGSLNAAEAYRIDHVVGSLTPGLMADVLVLNDLATLDVDQVIVGGKVVASGGQMKSATPSSAFPKYFLDTVRLDDPVTSEDISLSAGQSNGLVNVLCMSLERSGGVIRRRRYDAKLPVRGGKVQPDPSRDVLYISVTDRHSGGGSTGVGFVRGYGLKRGAIATSLSPDDDNIICIGASVPDMVTAINHIASVGGGQVVVDSGAILAEIRLPLCGLMADVSADEMASMERRLNTAAHDLGINLPRPFFPIMFLSITATPGFSITDRGFVDNASHSVVNPILGHAGAES